METESLHNVRSTFRSVPILHQIEIVNSGKKLIEDTVETLKGTVELETKNASRLLKLSKKQKAGAWGVYENLDTSLTNALSGLRKYFSDGAQTSTYLGNYIREHILLSFETEMNKENDVVNRQKQSYEQTMRAVTSCENNLSKAKKHLMKMKNEMEDCKRRLEIALSKPAASQEPPASEGPFGFAVNLLPGGYDDPQKWRAKLYKAEESLRAAQQQVEDSKKELFETIKRADETQLECARCFQISERLRIEEIKSALEKLVIAEQEALDKQIASLARFRDTVTLVNADLDHETVIRCGHNPDHTHLSGKALEMLDWNYTQQIKKAAEKLDPDKLSQAQEARINLEKQMEEFKVWLDELFPDADKQAVVSMSHAAVDATDRLCKLVVEKGGRDSYLQLLNKKRSVQTEVPDSTFGSLVHVSKAFLDACLEQQDIGCAKQLMIMANTFYRVRNSEERGSNGLTLSGLSLSSTFPPNDATGNSTCDIDDSPLEGDVPVLDTSASQEDLHRSRLCCREYLQSHLKEHQIWTSLGYWQQALLKGVLEQFELFSEPLLWDELTDDARHDAILRVHNILYSELASTAFNMTEFGVGKDMIFEFVDEKCFHSQLCEDQVLQLKKNITRTIHEREVQQR